MGLDRGVFYSQDGPAEVWNGLIAVDETPSDDDAQVRYIDGVKTYLRRRPGEFSGSVEAYTYPDSLNSYISAKVRKSFGFSYRISKSNGFEIHLVYNAKFSPEGFSRNQFESSNFKWRFNTLPIPIAGAKPSAHLIVDTSKAYSWTVEEFESVLYGSESADARLPLPEEVLAIFESNSIVKVVDHGDGTFTVSGPDEVIQMLDETTFSINWPSAVYIDSDTYTISSL